MVPPADSIEDIVERSSFKKATFDFHEVTSYLYDYFDVHDPFAGVDLVERALSIGTVGKAGISWNQTGKSIERGCVVRAGTGPLYSVVDVGYGEHDQLTRFAVVPVGDKDDLEAATRARILHDGLEKRFPAIYTPAFIEHFSSFRNSYAVFNGVLVSEETSSEFDGDERVMPLVEGIDRVIIADTSIERDEGKRQGISFKPYMVIFDPENVQTVQRWLRDGNDVKYGSRPDSCNTSISISGLDLSDRGVSYVQIDDQVYSVTRVSTAIQRFESNPSIKYRRENDPDFVYVLSKGPVSPIMAITHNSQDDLTPVDAMIPDGEVLSVDNDQIVEEETMSTNNKGNNGNGDIPIGQQVRSLYDRVANLEGIGGKVDTILREVQTESEKYHQRVERRSLLGFGAGLATGLALVVGIIAGHKYTVSNIQEQAAKYGPQVEAFVQDVGRLKQTLPELQRDLATLSNSYSALEADFSTVDPKLRDLSQRVTTARENVDDLKRVSEELIGKLPEIHRTFTVLPTANAISAAITVYDGLFSPLVPGAQAGRLALYNQEDDFGKTTYIGECVAQLCSSPLMQGAKGTMKDGLCYENDGVFGLALRGSPDEKVDALATLCFGTIDADISGSVRAYVGEGALSSKGTFVPGVKK